MNNTSRTTLTQEQTIGVIERFLETIELPESASAFEKFQIRESLVTTINALVPFVAEAVREPILAEVANALSEVDPDAQAIVSSMRTTN